MSKSTTKTYDENDTITIRSKKGPKANFVQVSKEIVYNVGLSVLARHLLTTLLSFPEYYTCKKTGLIKEWQIVDSFLMELLLCKRKKLQKAFKELRIAGYVTLIYPKKENGDFKGSHREFDYYPIFNDFEGTLEQEGYKTKIEKRKTHITNSNSADLKIKEIINLGINEVYGEVIFGTVPKTTSEDNNNRNNINKKTDLDLGNTDHNLKSESCVEKEVEVRDQKPQAHLKPTQPKAITAKKVAKTIEAQGQEKISSVNAKKVASIAVLKSVKNPKVEFTDKVPWFKLPINIHEAEIEERLASVNISQAKINELVTVHGKEKLMMVWADMKTYVIENPSIAVKNVAGLFLKRLMTTEALLGIAPARIA